MRMKKFLILVITTIALVSCDFLKDPIVLGTSQISTNDDGKFVCHVSSQLHCNVDSLLTLQNGKRAFIEPVVNSDVTVFTFGTEDEIYFYQGVATADDIKKVYFQGDTSNATINMFIFSCVLIILASIVANSKNKST